MVKNLLLSLLLTSALQVSAIPFVGADVSSLLKNEARGARYLDASGTPAYPLALLRDHGANTLRVRVWVASHDGHLGLADTLALARRAHALGLKLLVDFHYSDTWADPAHQTPPAAWAAYDLDRLVAAVATHTRQVCQALADQGTPAHLVQIGNEINDGLLWPHGRITSRGHPGNFAPLARLLRAGIDAARAAHPDTKIALHLGHSTDLGLFRWWFDGIAAQGVPWDYTGVSYYPYLHGTPAQLQTALDALAARYQRPVLVLETAYPFTLENADTHPNILGRPAQLLPDYPATPGGQAAFLREVVRVVRRVPENRGAGVLYWDATWTATPGAGWDNRDPTSGNAWENQALFDFTARPLPALRAFLPGP